MRNQSCLGGKFEPGKQPTRQMLKLAYGMVRETFPREDMVSIILDDNSILEKVPYLKDSSYYDFDKGSYTASKIKMPKKGSMVLIGYINGKKDNPVILGCLRNSKDKITKAKDNQWLEVHPSGAWWKIDDNGSFEFQSPDGTYFKIGISEAASESFSGVGGNSNYKFVAKANGEVLIEQMASGAKIKITTDGMIEIGAAPAFKAVLGDNLKTAYDAHTHTGNLGFPTSPPSSPLPDTALSEKITLE